MARVVAPSLVLDTDLPPKTWERRTGTNRVIKRSRYELTEELLVEAMEDPKTEKIAFGEEAHAVLRRILSRPGFKTPSQRAAEEAAKLARTAAPAGTLGPGGTAS